MVCFSSSGTTTYSREQFIRKLLILIIYIAFFVVMNVNLIFSIYFECNFYSICFAYSVILLYVFLIQDVYADLIKDFDNRTKIKTNIRSNGRGGGYWDEPSSWVGYEVPTTGD